MDEFKGIQENLRASLGLFRESSSLLVNEVEVWSKDADELVRLKKSELPDVRIQAALLFVKLSKALEAVTACQACLTELNIQGTLADISFEAKQGN